MISRADHSTLANWWWTIDRFILAAAIILLGLGLFLSFAASPPMTSRIGIADSFHFVKLHVKYVLPAFLGMIVLSFFSLTRLRQFSILLLGIAGLLALMVLFIGVEIKGATRWITLLGITIQPSEFLKPAFILVSAILFASVNKWGKSRSFALATLLYIFCALLLVLEPDIGQTLLISLTWAGMFFLAGMPILLVGLFILLAICGGLAAYYSLPYVQERINSFLTGEGDNFQVDVGREAILRGGWLGQGPGEGTVKRLLPDAHTDFVFSVAAEEYGIILCLIMVVLFAFIVLRALMIAKIEPDAFVRYAISGIAMLFGLQSIINMAVNLHLMPPKGMTLPFISYGGSSLLAIGITMGLLLALTRRRPEARGRHAHLSLAAAS